MSNESIEGEDIRLIVSEKEVHHVKKGATVAYSQEGIVSIGDRYCADLPDTSFYLADYELIMNSAYAGRNNADSFGGRGFGEQFES